MRLEMRTTTPLFLAGILVLSPLPAIADQQSFLFGGDSYAAGQTTSIAQPVARDAFEAGNTVMLSVPVAQDAHLAGFDVQSTSDIGGNLYAAGFSVSVGGTVKGDITAFGNTVSVHTTQPLSGNVRGAAASFTLDSPADGAVLITANTATINAPIKGDLSFYGQTLAFGPNAVVSGNLLIHAPKAIAVPSTVASPERVTFTELTSPEYPAQVGQTAEIVAKGFWASVWTAVAWFVLLLLVGAAFVALNPRLVASLETLAAVRPVRRFGLGILAFASVVGLVPVAAFTVVGLLLVPFVLIFVFIACSLAYLAGAYLIGNAIGGRVVPIKSTGQKIAAMAVSLVVAALLVAIPFLGWLISLVIVAYGFGVIAALVMTRWSADDGVKLSSVTAPTAGAADAPAI
jgi:hypothetical protein